MQLTDRDVAILDAVCNMRFLTSDQIQLLLFSPSTASSCRRRLTLLYHNGYLDRLLIPMKNAFGSSRAVYMLARRGAEFVARARRSHLSQLDWRHDEIDRELFFIRHTLSTNDFRIILALAAPGIAAEVEWTDERALRSRQMKDYVDDPKTPGRRLAIVPDGYFTLSWAASAASFAVEIDRATVEEKPFKEKIRGYGEWKVTGAYESRYGTKSLRVLWIVADQSRDKHRLARIKSWAEAEGAGSLFWFARLDDLSPGTALRERVWYKGGSTERHALITEN